MQSKVLILGANGFLGKNVVHKLGDFQYETLRVYSAFIKSKNNKNAYLDDEYLIKYFENNSFSHLLFLSWPSSPPHNDIAHSLFASFAINLCEKFATAYPRGHIYFAGSIHEVGISSLSPVPNSFEGCSMPDTLYGLAKRFVWDSLQKICADRLCWIRFANMYGPGDHPYKVLSQMINARLNNKEFILRNPSTYIDYVHVEDAAFGVCRVLQENYAGVVNIGSGRGYYLKDIQDFLATGSLCLNENLPSNDGPILDISFTQQLLKYNPKISICTGLASLLHTYEASNNIVFS